MVHDCLVVPVCNPKMNFSQLVVRTSKFLAHKFHRMWLRGLDELENYKAADHRTVIVYLISLLFKNFLPHLYSKHLMLLHFSMYSFVSDEFSVTYFNQASSCISAFSQQAETLYSNKLQSCNVHILTHISAVVKEHGPLDHWSAFLYEYYNGILKLQKKHFSTYCEFHVIIRDVFASARRKPLYFSAHCPDNCYITESGHVVTINSMCYGHRSASCWALQFSSNL